MYPCVWYRAAEMTTAQCLLMFVTQGLLTFVTLCKQCDVGREILLLGAHTLLSHPVELPADVITTSKGTQRMQHNYNPSLLNLLKEHSHGHV